MPGFNKKFNNGIAMPIAVVIVAIIFLFCTTILSLNENLTRNVSFSSSQERALHIAEAGYNRFLYELNDNPGFYKISGGAPEHGFTVVESYTSADNPAWAGFPKKYDVMDYQEGATILGHFQIQIVPPSPLEPVITVISTGWTPENPSLKKTIKVQVSKRTFTSFVCFFGDMGTVRWGNSSHIRGPFFTNAHLQTTGSPTFYDEVGYVGSRDYINGSPVFKMTGQPQRKSPLAFPSSSSELRKWAEGTDYLFTGRTSIRMHENGKLTIRSKGNSDAIQEVNVPSSGVIYVDGDVFIAGTLNGKLTVGSSRNIYICSKDPTNFTPSAAQELPGLTYANDNIPTSRENPTGVMSDDMLGLVADGDLIIATTTWPSTNSSGKTTYNPSSVVKRSKNLYIYAAMLGRSGNSSYYAENLDYCGDYGSVYLRGSVATPKSGGTYQTLTLGGIRGFVGDYTFDYRMLYESPPRFLEPENSGWEVKSWEEVDNP